MNTIRFWMGAAVMACAGSAAAVVAPAYTAVYGFGDSLTDTGRVAVITDALTPAVPGDGFPGPLSGYAAGRFSNGAVAIEAMTPVLTGNPLPFANNYAHGGARTGTSPYSGIDNNNALLAGTGLLAQTTMFRTTVGAGNADPNALYFVWAGANDFTEPQVLGDLNGDWNRVIGNIETAIGNLAQDGARHFFVPNLPNLGLAPYSLAFGPTAAATASLLTGAYNTQFQARMTALDAANPGIDIRVFDVYAYMTSFIAQVNALGSLNGISDVTTPCRTATGPAATDFSLCGNPAAHFFWDDRHPADVPHALLGADFAQAAMVPEPQTYALMLAGLGLLGMAARRRATGTNAPR